MAETENNATVVSTETEPVVTVTEVKTPVPVVIEEPATAEVVKPPAEDPIGWLSALGRNAVNKVSYQVLDWTNKTAVEEDKRQPTPGAKKESTSPTKFLDFLKDGTVLGNLANKLQPGSIEAVHEGEAAKEPANQTENLNNFIGFLKNKAGLNEEEVFSAADVQEKKKGGFGAVLGSLIKLAQKSMEQFGQQGLDTEQLLQIAKQAAQSNFIQTILNFFKKRPAVANGVKKDDVPIVNGNGKEHDLKEEEVPEVKPLAVEESTGVAVAVQ